MMHLRSLLAALVSLPLVTSAAWANCDPGETSLTFGVPSEADSEPRARFAKAFGAALDTALQGKFCVRVLSFTALYDDGDAVPAVAVGEIQLAAPRLVALAGLEPRVRLFGLPFAFRDARAVQAMVDGDGWQPIAQGLTNRGAVPLAVVHAGFLQMASRAAIVSPDDAKGRRFRQPPGSTRNALTRTLGASVRPVPLEGMKEAYTAGSIDVVVGDWQFLQRTEAAGFGAGVTQTNHRYRGYGVLASANWWTTLEAPVRQTILETAQKVAAQANTETQRRLSEARRAVMVGGTPVRALTDRQRRAWRGAVAGIWDGFQAAGRESLMEALDLANAVP